jgi:serine/threonine-protein kinase HipA
VREIRRLGSRPRDDLAELWRRAVFTVLISDKDNHLRNHGLVLGETGWRLAPAYDMNPAAQKLKPRELAISLDGVDDRAALKPLFEKCEEYALTQDDAIAIAMAVATKVRGWRERAKAMRLPEEEMRKMRPAFEHDDLELALRGKGG